jgi:hypothetical protein
MFEQKLYICPCRRLFTEVENEIRLGRHLFALVDLG